jgi:prepilin-type N-terminal cleavage/methylation domain-containing protein
MKNLRRHRWMPSSPQQRARGGFSMIELLAVLVILGILMVVLLPRLRGAQDIAEEKLTRNFLTELDAAIAEYETHFGDYPPSQFLEKWGPPSNATNVGAEALVLSLWSTEWGGVGLSEDSLVNTDNDETKKAMARFPAASLFELGDHWGNPIAYLHRRDYGKTVHYSTSDPTTGEPIESNVTARMSSKTKSYANPTRYQLISAGQDGQFGTEDDITNFKVE